MPDSSEIPARGAALFGAVAAGLYATSAPRSPRRDPAPARTYMPDPEPKRIYDDVYAMYRNLYETLGRTQVELMHELKRIRNREEGRDEQRKPRIGLLGIMQELYDEMIPGITEHQAAYAASVARG